MIINIRPVRLEDAADIHEMRILDGVRENTLGFISERVGKTQERICTLTEYEHSLVAEVEENGVRRVVGEICLFISRNPRLRHSGSIGIMVHPDYQGKGVGKVLFEKILDLADNWLMLKRLELGVFTDNERAIKLYESMGFVIEGTKKYAAARNGEYADEYFMARYNLK